MGNKNPKVSYTLRIVAGAYVAYLGVSVARMPFKEETGLPMAAAVALGVLLALAGVAFVISGLKGYKYMKDHPEEFEEEEDTEAASDETETAETAPVSTSSLLYKASMPDHLQVSDEEEADSVDPEETAE